MIYGNHSFLSHGERLPTLVEVQKAVRTPSLAQLEQACNQNNFATKAILLCEQTHPCQAKGYLRSCCARDTLCDTPPSDQGVLVHSACDAIKLGRPSKSEKANLLCAQRHPPSDQGVFEKLPCIVAVPATPCACRNTRKRTRHAMQHVQHVGQT